MSLAIDVDNVVSVLLADGWHLVIGKSFYLDSYEFTEGGEPLSGGGIGFGFLTRGSGPAVTMYGPMAAILAVSYREPE